MSKRKAARTLNRMITTRLRNRTPRGLRFAAMFEAAKGILVLTTGFGLMLLIHEDLHHAAEQILKHIHLNPASHYPLVFIDAINHLNDWQLWALALSALLYSLVRLIEAYGLWNEKQWAEWFGFLTGGMYIPLEIYEIMESVTWPKVTVLTINTLIVAILAFALIQSRRPGNTK